MSRAPSRTREPQRRARAQMAGSLVGVDSEEPVEEAGETRQVVNLSGEVQQLQLASSPNEGRGF